MAATIPATGKRTRLSAYNVARAAAIHASERVALRAAEQGWCAQPTPVPVHRTRRPSPWLRLRRALVRDFGRGWWLALIGSAIYFVGGAAAWALVLAVQVGGWQP